MDDYGRLDQAVVTLWPDACRFPGCRCLRGWACPGDTSRGRGYRFVVSRTAWVSSIARSTRIRRWTARQVMAAFRSLLGVRSVPRWVGTR